MSGYRWRRGAPWKKILPPCPPFTKSWLRPWSRRTGYYWAANVRYAILDLRRFSVVVLESKRSMIIVSSSTLEMCGNGFQHSHSLLFPSIQFPFPPIPIPNFLTYSHSHGIPVWAIPIPSHSHSVNAKIVYNY